MKTVMIVEDDPCQQDILRKLLNMNFYATLIFNDGDEAWACYTKPDILVTDLNFCQGMSGLDLIKEIVCLPVQEIPDKIIVVTGNAGDDELSGMYRKGIVNKILQKPYSLSTLLRAFL